MAIPIQVINVGMQPNDGTGDPDRVVFQKINTNFAVVAGALANTGNASNITSGTLPVAQLPNLTQPVAPIAAAMAIIFGA